jgi:carbon storage regulator
MLVLSRKVGEEIVLGNQVRVRVTAVHGKRVSLAIAAPAHVAVHRAEILSQWMDVPRAEEVIPASVPRSA